MNYTNLAAAIEGIRVAEDECRTIAEYSERLRRTAEISETDAQMVEPQYTEIIKDELNHALRAIFNIYCALTGIEPDTDGIEGEVKEEGDDADTSEA